MQKNTKWWQWESFFSHISYYLISIKYPWFRCGARKSFCLGVLCTQVSGVWSRCARGISTLYSCAVIYSPSAWNRLRRGRHGYSRPYISSRNKIWEKSQNIEKIEKQIAHAPLIFFFTGTCWCIRRAYIYWLIKLNPIEPPCLMSVDPNSF